MSIVITYKDGEVFRYNKDVYTDYEYDCSCFIVIKDFQWIGIHSIERIKRITIGDERVEHDCVYYVNSIINSAQ